MSALWEGGSRLGCTAEAAYQHQWLRSKWISNGTIITTSSGDVSTPDACSHASRQLGIEEDKGSRSCPHFQWLRLRGEEAHPPRGQLLNPTHEATPTPARR